MARHFRYLPFLQVALLLLVFFKLKDEELIPGKTNIRNAQEVARDEDAIDIPPVLGSCKVPTTVETVSLIRDVNWVIKKHRITNAIFSVSTLDSLPSLKLQLESIEANAPGIANNFIIFCVGTETCSKCEMFHDKCIADKPLDKVIDGAKGAKSLSEGSYKSSAVDKVYIDIIWRKPELIEILFLTGVESVLTVDSDGIWFNYPPDFKDSVASSSEYMALEDFLVDRYKCEFAMVFRKAPLVLNSGTVFIRRDEIGKEVLSDWLALRSEMPEGVCNVENGEYPRDSMVLDQDGLNIIACKKGKHYSGKIRGLSSNQVLLNSVHSLARQEPQFDMCNVWFFHSTNCGSYRQKHLCLEINMKRWRDKGCFTRRNTKDKRDVYND